MLNLKDKEYELKLQSGTISGSLKIKNYNNRVLASIGDIIVDQLTYDIKFVQIKNM